MERHPEQGTKSGEDRDKAMPTWQFADPSSRGAAQRVYSLGQQLQQQSSECIRSVSNSLQRSAQVGGQLLNAGLVRASTMVGKDPSSLQHVSRNGWHRAVEVSTHLWEKIEPRISNYLPEDRSPLWVFSVVILVLCLAIAGLKTDIQHRGTPKEEHALPITAARIQLPDGRYIAYREQGVPPDVARHSILVVHNILSSRLAGIPGIKDELLQEFGVRVVSYDRPGFGQSDPYPHLNLESSAKDMADIADVLKMGDKFWVLGCSSGGIYAWAAMKYIPERLEGVAMFAPGGNIYSPNMTKEESRKIWDGFTLRRKLVYVIARRASPLLPFFFQRALLQRIDKYVDSLAATLGKKDQALFDQEFFLEALNRDIRESIRQSNAVALAQETILQTIDWGFHLSDLCIRIKPSKPIGLFQWLKSFFQKPEEDWHGFTGPIHIWQGMEDQLVPPGINEFSHRMVPQSILHKLEGEGHFSYFWFCDICHREIFEALFGQPEGPIDMVGAAPRLSA